MQVKECLQIMLHVKYPATSQELFEYNDLHKLVAVIAEGGANCSLPINPFTLQATHLCTWQ